MRSIKVPSRPAPPVSLAFQRSTTNNQRTGQQQTVKKKPPPRPPPPKFNQVKSKSTWNLNQPFEDSLIDLSPPESPKNFVANRNRAFGGSVSSSFSSSTSSLASSKKSFEYDSVNGDPWSQVVSESQSTFYVEQQSAGIPQFPLPTIIRAKQNLQPAKKEPVSRNQSPPMPSVPPPSPPKNVSDITVPYGIALFDYLSTQPGDLCLQENDVVFLLRQINNEWYYGRIEDKEGMFPSDFISVEVPLPQDDRIVTAVYEFTPQFAGDLALKPGQIVRVTGKSSNDWLLGESEGRVGQFPANFVNRIPSTL